MTKKVIGVVLLFVFVSAVLPIYAVTPTYEYSSAYKSSSYYTKLQAVTLTGNQRTDIVNVALSQYGYTEGNYSGDFGGTSNGANNYTEYQRMPGVTSGQGNANAGWCAAFVSWCARQAGVPTSVLANCTTSSVTGFGLNKTSVPEVGSLAFVQFDSDVNIDHTALVYAVDDTYVYTIEGNRNNKVDKRQYYRSTGKQVNYSATYIEFYGTPAYNNSWTETPTDVEAPTISDLTVKDVNGESFTIECNLSDNVGVTRVWFVLYAPGGEYQFGESASNGKFSYEIDTSKYGGAGKYSFHLYAYDAVDNKAKEVYSSFYNILPENCTLQADKTLLSVGETITFTITANYGEKYAFGIGDGTNVLVEPGLVNSNTYSYTFTKPGVYYVWGYVENSVGSVGISGIPYRVYNKPTISLNKGVNSLYYANENVSIDIDAPGAISAYLGFYKSGVDGYYRTANVLNCTNYITAFNEIGEYSVYLWVKYDSGEISTEQIKFRVNNDCMPPVNQSISINKGNNSCYMVNEIITISCNALYDTRRVLGVYKEGHTGYYADYVITGKDTHQIKISEPGNYTIYMWVNNPFGEATSNYVDFSVTDINVPALNSTLLVDKSNYYIGETVTFDFFADNETYKCIGIYKDNNTESYYAAPEVVNLNSYQIIFKEPGVYKAWLYASNEYGGCSSDYVYFNVIEKTYTKTRITKNAANYNCAVSVWGVDKGEIIIAGYKGGKFVTLTKVPYESEEINTTLSGDIDEIKVMVWDALGSFKPVCEMVSIPESEFLTE